MILQLNPSIPVNVLGKGYGEAVCLIDYSKEDDLLWVVALDSTGEVWSVKNSDIRFIKNYSIGRDLKDKPKLNDPQNALRCQEMIREYNHDHTKEMNIITSDSKPEPIKLDWDDSDPSWNSGGV